MLREVAEPSHKDCVRFVRTRIGVKVRHQLPPQIKSNARIGRIFRRRIENIRYPMNCAPWSFRASSDVARAQRNAVVLSWRCRYLIADDDDRRGRVCASSVRYGSWWMLRCAAGLPARGLCTLPFCNKLAVHAKVWPRPEH